LHNFNPITLEGTSSCDLMTIVMKICLEVKTRKHKYTKVSNNAEYYYTVSGPQQL